MQLCWSWLFLRRKGPLRSEAVSQSEPTGDPTCSRLLVNSTLGPNAFYSTSGSNPTCLPSQITIQPFSPLPVSLGFACQLPVVVLSSSLHCRITWKVIILWVNLRRPADLCRTTGLCCREGIHFGDESWSFYTALCSLKKDDGVACGAYVLDLPAEWWSGVVFTCKLKSVLC